jgi:hypothetical protein
MDAIAKDAAKKVDTHLAGLADPNRREQAGELDALFRRVTGFQPYMPDHRMIGYGRYAYTYASGRSGVTLATGFAVAPSKFSIYIMPGYTDFGEILARIGKHKMAKSCLYVNKLADIDMPVLGELIVAGLGDLATHWPVEPT